LQTALRSAEMPIRRITRAAIRGRFAFVSGTGVSPNRPTHFEANTQSLLSAINLSTGSNVVVKVKPDVSGAVTPIPQGRGASGWRAAAVAG
jgi:hypothetical protein